MKCLICPCALLLATVCAAPAVFAGNVVLKCVDANGHITLTDQACPGAVEVTRLVNGSDPGPAIAPTPDAPLILHQRPLPFVLPPLRYARGDLPQRQRTGTLDVATMKAAHAQVLLLDAQRPMTRLATLR